MKIIEIAPLENFAHRNQECSGNICVPDGWAVLPSEINTANFPFGDVEVDASTPPRVISWTPRDIPETPGSDPEPTVEERLDTLEDALAQTDETAIALYEANEEQSQINAAQDEALIEIYEMMEG